MEHETKFTVILVVIGLAVAAGVLVPFFIWGDEMETAMAGDEWQDKFASIQSWAWLVIIGLLIADLVLPVPNSPLMAIAGTLYGTLWGCLIAAAGSILAGLVAYGLAYALGHKAINRIATAEEREKFQQFFDRWGGGGIVVSRAMPVMPEVLTVLAGLARMHFGRFMVSLVLGAFAVALPLAWVGHQAGGNLQTVTIVISIVTVAVWALYLVILTKLHRRPSKVEAAHDSE
jgi:uncharacterized membrane protein YdjX (TVP38/TMEM64 family)